MKKIAIGFGMFGVALLGIASAVEVRFWATLDPMPPPGTEAKEHPCGGVIEMDTDKVPADTPWRRASLVHEITAAGDILRTWKVPIEFIPEALDGDALILVDAARRQQTLKVTLDGTILAVPTPPKTSLPIGKCPGKLSDEFHCSVISDSPRKLLAFEPVCS